MVKEEKFNERDMIYKNWHRTLGEGYITYDIDFVEYRQGRGIVAVLGVTGRCKDRRHIENSFPMILQRTKIEREILLTVAEKLNVPAFFVIHTEDMKHFYVGELKNKEWKFMNEYEYKILLKGL